MWEGEGVRDGTVGTGCARAGGCDGGKIACVRSSSCLQGSTGEEYCAEVVAYGRPCLSVCTLLFV